MKSTVAALLTSAFLVGTASASEKLVIAPAPAWIKPVALPVEASTPDEAPVHILLSDQQVSLDHAEQTVYSRVSFRIQTPQGLPASNLTFSWRPETDTLTVHSILIRRGAQIIDVLASGQTFTVLRRETNLENATLNGVLTATLQPEGVQVGDTVEFAASVTSHDPVLKGHVEQLAGAWNELPISHAHLRMQWTSDVRPRLRSVGPLPQIKPLKAGAVTTAEIALDGITPVVPPAGAPVRYAMGRLIELTDYTSWSDVAALMAPLFETAEMLPSDGPLRGELDRIRAASSDPKTRAQAALSLVQDRVRYVALAMGAGGLVPAGATTTWSRRFGDCKGKTALLIALLRAMDVEAEPVLVNTVLGDGLDARLPMIALFDHVLVRATIAGKIYWLDGTRNGDTDLERLQTPAYGWGLPVRSSGATLLRMVPAPLTVPAQDVTIRIDASAGLASPAPATVETVLRGDAALQLKANLANLVGAARDTALRAYWKSQYDFIDIKTASATFDAAAGEQHLSLSGTAKMDWSGDSYETDSTRVGYRADFTRAAGTAANVPFAVPYPNFARTRETIILPKGQGDFRIGKDTAVDQTVAGIHYERHASITGNLYVIEKTERSLAPEFPAADAPGAQIALRALAGKVARLEQPVGYASTDADVAAAQATAPTTSEGYVGRAMIFLSRGMRAEALRDYDKAVSLDPGNVYAWANRAITRVQAKDYAGARADIAKSDAIDPRFGQTFIARGMLADDEHRPADAISAYTAALKSDPGNDYALMQRSAAYAQLGDIDHAIVDKTARITAKPDIPDLLVDRANYEADMGRSAAAEADYAAANAIKPSATSLLDHAMHRSRSDLVHRQEDIDAALRLEPGNATALSARAELSADRGDFPAAIASYTQALVTTPRDPSLLAARGVVHARSGDITLAEKDFAAVRQIADTADTNNELCWDKAIKGVTLDAAVKDCERAIALASDDSQVLDSYGFVLLRLGRHDAAIAAYDRALAADPYLPTSLYGRGVAYTRKGDTLRGKNDLAAARKITASVGATFAYYGIAVP
jgi:tetratricopeptide (TPR) repeat protein